MKNLWDDPPGPWFWPLVVGGPAILLVLIVQHLH